MKFQPCFQLSAVSFCLESIVWRSPPIPCFDFFSPDPQKVKTLSFFCRTRTTDGSIWKWARFLTSATITFEWIKKNKQKKWKVRCLHSETLNWLLTGTKKNKLTNLFFSAIVKVLRHVNSCVCVLKRIQTWTCIHRKFYLNFLFVSQQYC